MSFVLLESRGKARAVLYMVSLDLKVSHMCCLNISHSSLSDPDRSPRNRHENPNRWSLPSTRSLWHRCPGSMSSEEGVPAPGFDG